MVSRTALLTLDVSAVVDRNYEVYNYWTYDEVFHLIVMLARGISAYYSNITDLGILLFLITILCDNMVQYFKALLFNSRTLLKS